MSANTDSFSKRLSSQLGQPLQNIHTKLTQSKDQRHTISIIFKTRPIAFTALGKASVVDQEAAMMFQLVLTFLLFYISGKFLFLKTHF